MTGKQKTARAPFRKGRCTSCQRRHLKCEYDGVGDTCIPCRNGKRKCTVQHRFQFVDPSVPKRTKRETVTETEVFQTELESTSVSDEAEVQQPAVEETAVREIESQAEEQPKLTDVPPREPSPVPLRNVAFEQDTSMAGSFRSPISNDFHEADILTSPAAYQTSAFAQPSPIFQSPTFLATPEHLQLVGKEKALLLRHFTNVLSKWFDVCDPDFHFKRVVPARALTCPTLLKAISASSAWHLNRLGVFDQERSNYLYENCLDHLIRAMRGPEVGSDDSLLVAAVIMHHVEELRDLEHTLNLESRGHIIAMKVFLDNQNLTSECSSLRTAAFRTAHREELHLSFLDQQPLILPLEAANVDRTWNEADDDTWAWRIILTFKECLSFSLSPSTADDWDTLWQSVQTWYELRPPTFEPTLYLEANPIECKYLPEIWFLHDCHSYGAIHYYMCHLVLAISNPRTPKFGWNRAEAVKRVQEEVKASVVEICGIAMSNSEFPPGMTAATAVITLFAESITDPDVQAALLDVMVQTRKIHAWPTEAAQQYVRNIWQVRST